MSSKNTYDVALSEIILALHSLDASTVDDQTIVNQTNGTMRAILGIDDVMFSEGSKVITPCTVSIDRNIGSTSYIVQIKGNRNIDPPNLILSTFNDGDKSKTGPLTINIDTSNKWWNIMMNKAGDILVDSSNTLETLTPSTDEFQYCAPIATLYVPDAGETAINEGIERLDGNNVSIWNWTIVGREVDTYTDYVYVSAGNSHITSDFLSAPIAYLSAVSKSGITVGWQNCSATTYEYQYMNQDDSEWGESVLIAGTNLSASFITNFHGAQWSLRVRAIRGSTISEWSNTVIGLSTPATPINLTANYSEIDNELIFTWDVNDPIFGVHAMPVSYAWKILGSATNLGSTSTTQVNLLGLLPGVISFSLNAKNASGQSEEVMLSYTIVDEEPIVQPLVLVLTTPAEFTNLVSDYATPQPPFFNPTIEMKFGEDTVLTDLYTGEVYNGALVEIPAILSKIYSFSITGDITQINVAIKYSESIDSTSTGFIQNGNIITHIPKNYANIYQILIHAFITALTFEDPLVHTKLNAIELGEAFGGKWNPGPAISLLNCSNFPALDHFIMSNTISVINAIVLLDELISGIPNPAPESSSRIVIYNCEDITDALKERIDTLKSMGYWAYIGVGSSAFYNG